jgi:hypothetical protein
MRSWALRYIIEKRRGGIIALLLGFVSCGAFVAGLRWLI